MASDMKVTGCTGLSPTAPLSSHLCMLRILESFHPVVPVADAFSCSGLASLVQGYHHGKPLVAGCGHYGCSRCDSSAALQMRTGEPGMVTPGTCCCGDCLSTVHGSRSTIYYQACDWVMPVRLLLLLTACSRLAQLALFAGRRSTDRAFLLLQNVLCARCLPNYAGTSSVFAVTLIDRALRATGVDDARERMAATGGAPALQPSHACQVLVPWVSPCLCTERSACSSSL